MIEVYFDETEKVWIVEVPSAPEGSTRHERKTDALSEARELSRKTGLPVRAYARARRESLRLRLGKIARGEQPEIGALHGCPQGVWPETKQALARLVEHLPPKEGRTYQVWDLVDELYFVDQNGRYAWRVF